MRNFKLFAAILALAWLLSASASAQLTQTKAGHVAGGGGPPPTCAGVIDASIGCPMPMLGM